MKKLLGSATILTILLLSSATFADDHKAKSVDYMPSLITATPLEGRQLAILMVRKTIGTIQRDSEAKHRVRKIYAEDPMMLMQAAKLVAMEFKVIAEANNYWK
jgi:hexameric tyrosine-coordinated heme protein (HTHP)